MSVEDHLRFTSIAEVYEANDRVRADLIALVEGLSDAEAATLTEKGDWTVAGIVEHLAMAEEGMAKVAGHLLKKAEDAGVGSDGSLKISDEFKEKIKTWEQTNGQAPEMVHPTGRSIAESLEMMAENRRHLSLLREKFEKVEGTELKFPHPAFGPLSAHDWLALIGGHESRHVEQIGRLLGSGS